MRCVMPIDNAHRHPSTYTDAELLAMLRAERWAITERLSVLKREVHERVSEINTLETRLDNIEVCELYLTTKMPSLPRRDRGTLKKLSGES
jgi:hypothetical protein